MTERTATAQDVCDRFEVTPPSVSRMVADGCPHDKVKNRTFFNLDEVAAWVKVRRPNLGQTGGDRKSLSYRASNGTQITDRTERKEVDEALELEIAQAHAKLRKDLAAAETAELKLEMMRGELVPKEKVLEDSLAKIARARAVLLGGPSILSQDTIGDQEHDEALISEWIHRALNELASEE